MKRTLSFALAAVMSLGLAACGNSAEIAASTAKTAEMTDDAEYVLLPDAVAALPEGTTGGTIAFATDRAGTEDAAANAAIWHGVQTFAEQFGFTANSFTAAEDGTLGAENALRLAAESGAGLVVCTGEDMAAALYSIQGNYPSVSYLILDDEPHSLDYTAYSTQSNVHCVLFNEEQAAFLAGYAAVMEGYTELGYLGSETMPGVVRYATGFMQGAEAAGEQTGLQVRLKTWYCGTETGTEDITARMSGWYSDGTQLIFAGAGNLAQSCVDAAQEGGGKVIAANWDQQALGAEVLTTAEKCYSRATQQKLYAFYAARGSWAPELAGQTARMGTSDLAVALPTLEWRFNSFKREDYATLYEQLRTSVVKVARYADADTLPELANVTVDAQN